MSTLSEDTIIVSQAKVLLTHGKGRQAESTLRDAIARGADRAEVHGMVGDLLSRSGRHADAIPELGRACQLASDSIPYCRSLSSALIGDNRYSVALDFLNAELARSVKPPGYHYNVGLAEFGLRLYADVCR